MKKVSNSLRHECLLLIKGLSFNIEVHKFLKGSFRIIPSEKINDLEVPYLQIKKIATDFYHRNYKNIEVSPNEIKVKCDLFHYNKEFLEKKFEKACCEIIYNFKKAICNLYSETLLDPNKSTKKLDEATEMEKIITILQEFITTHFNVVFDHAWISLDGPNGLLDPPESFIYFRDWRKKLLSQIQ